MWLIFISELVLTWKNNFFFLCSSSARFTPAHFWIGFNPHSVHPIPREPGGQVPGDPGWLRVEKHQPVPGGPLCCPSPWGEAFQPPRAVCLGGHLECHSASVRSPCGHLQGDLSSQGCGSCWSDDNNIYNNNNIQMIFAFLQSNLQSTDRYKSEALISKGNSFSIYMLKHANTSREKENFCTLHCLESLHNFPPNCLMSVHFNSE